MTGKTSHKAKIERLGTVLLVIVAGLYSVRVILSVIGEASQELSATQIFLVLIPCFHEQFLIVLWCSITVVFGILRYRKHEKRALYLFRVLYGVTIIILFVGTNAASAKLVSMLVDLLLPPKNLVANLQSRLDKMDVRHPSYSQLTLIMAETKFLSTGEVSLYLDQEGNHKEYVPSERARETRNRIEDGRDTIKTSRGGAIFLLAILLLSVVAGFLVPVRVIAPNQAMHTDGPTAHR